MELEIIINNTAKPGSGAKISPCVIISQNFSQYGQLLLGKVVVEFLGTVVDYHVKGDVRLSDCEVYETHYHWTSEEEDHEEIELDDDEDYVPMENYYNKNIVGKLIIARTVAINFGVPNKAK